VKESHACVYNGGVMILRFPLLSHPVFRGKECVMLIIALHVTSELPRLPHGGTTH